MKKLGRNFAVAVAILTAGATAVTATEVTPEEARSIAKDAYIYGYPLVENYRIQYAYFVDESGSQYKGPWNEVINIGRVFTPKDTAIQTPNSDTPYSFVGADLRAEPIVLTVPKIDEKRYYSLQFIDWYTFNFAYVGTRTTGNDGGTYLLAGPGWQGDKPTGVDKIIQAETEFVFVGYRTQLFDPADIDHVRAIQAGYKATPLSEFLGAKDGNAATMERATPANFIAPLTQTEERTDLRFFDILNVVLNYAPTPPEEEELRARFAKINIGGDKNFDPSAFSSEVQEAIGQGMKDAWAEYDKFKKTKIDTGEVTSGDMFGTRKFIDGRWMYRMAGTIMGIYANSKQEAMYPLLTVDSKGQLLNGQNQYTLTFKAGEFPPANAFWSVTMYDLPQSLLVANPINRYLINSPMLPALKKAANGNLTIYIQNESPGPDKAANWLPAPKAGFWIPIRIYWPKEAALDGTWKAPAIERVED